MSPSPRGHGGKPHHQTLHATTTTATPADTTPLAKSRATSRRTSRALHLHNPAAIPQHLRVLGDQEVLRLHTSATTQRIWLATLVQAATLGEGVRDFLYDAFLHVARPERPPLATPESKSPPPEGDGVSVPLIDWGRRLVGQPEPGLVDTKGRTRCQEPNMAHSPASTTPTNTIAWEMRTWVDSVTSLSNFRYHVPGNVPTPDNQPPAPSWYMTFMYKRHYNLSTTHYHAPTDTWMVYGTNFLLPANYTPPPHNPGHDMYTREDEPDDPHIWGRWERRSLDALLSIRSRNQGLGRAMYCLAKWTQRTWQMPAEQCMWKVTLRPKQRKAPLNCTGPIPPRPATIQLCLYMVAARLMTVLWPGPDTPTGNYPHLTEEDMPGIQRCFFGK